MEDVDKLVRAQEILIATFPAYTGYMPRPLPRSVLACLQAATYYKSLWLGGPYSGYALRACADIEALLD
jgi:hypothetical protein